MTTEPKSPISRPRNQPESIPSRGSTSDEQIFRDLYGPLRRFAAVVGSIDVEPDDLVQEALAQVLSRGGLDRIDHPLAYLRRSILNLALNQNRDNGRQRDAIRLVGGSEQTAREPEYPSELWALLDLPPVDRAVLYLADVEGRGFGEIAELLGIRESTLRGRASRSRRLLRRRGDQKGTAQ